MGDGAPLVRSDRVACVCRPVWVQLLAPQADRSAENHCSYLPTTDRVTSVMGIVGRGLLIHLLAVRSPRSLSCQTCDIREAQRGTAVSLLRDRSPGPPPPSTCQMCVRFAACGARL